MKMSYDMALFHKPQGVPDRAGNLAEAVCIVYAGTLVCFYSSLAVPVETEPSRDIADADKGDWLYGMQLIHGGSENEVQAADWQLRVVWFEAVTSTHRQRGQEDFGTAQDDRWEARVTSFPIEGTAKAQQLYHWLSDPRRRDLFRFCGAAEEELTPGGCEALTVTPGEFIPGTGSVRFGRDAYMWAAGGTDCV